MSEFNNNLVYEHLDVVSNMSKNYKDHIDIYNGNETVSTFMANLEKNVSSAKKEVIKSRAIDKVD